MPIKEDDLIIYVEYNKKIVVMKNNKKVGEVLSDNNTYSNLEILKLITSTYGIECKGDDILNLLKYRSKIIAIFI